MSMLPPKRPQMERAQAEKILAARGVTDAVALLGVRGYYLDSQGKPGENDRGIYDDALFLVTPSLFAAFNYNTDPSAYRKGIATLVPGLWKYWPGIHGMSKPVAARYPALVQAAEVTVTRDGEKEETGWFGINIHRGGYSGTSSLGCQTIPPKQWDEFFGAVKRWLEKCHQKKLPYYLITETLRRQMLAK